jgi:hypothetical protein
LKDKGKKFTSDFLVITSNHPERTFRYAGKCVLNRTALLRRIYPAYEVLERRDNIYRVQTKTYDLIRDSIDTGPIKTLNAEEFVDMIISDALIKHRQRRDLTHFIVPIQAEGPFGTPAIGYKIPIQPSESLPKVMAHAIPEPLKVRMITKGEEELWVLKPVQKAMWKALQAFKCFELTSTPEIPFEFLNSWDQGGDILSGDYEAATDNLNMDVTKLAIDELCKVLPEPYSSWVKWEGGVHEIHYPPSSGLKPIIQTRGQLMGSLLSFPILCVANAAVISVIKKVDSLHDLQALINGDDILFVDQPRIIKSWKRLTKSIGLIPSVGKNYQSKNWGSINSQLIERNSEGQWSTTGTGCFGAINKVSQFKSNFKRALEIEPENKPYFIIKAKRYLTTTPESVDIPTSHGGLGPVFCKEPTLQDKEIYFFKILSKKIRKIRIVDDFAYYEVPKHLYIKYKGVLGQRTCLVPDPDLEIEDMDEKFPYKKFKEFQSWYRKIPQVRDRIITSDLTKEISLHRLTTVYIKIPIDIESLINNFKLRV